MRRASALLACLLACAAFGATTGATTGSTPAGTDGRGRDRAHTYLMLRVVDALDLSDDKALQMRDILRRADEKRLELAKRRDAIDAKLRAALAEKPIDSAALGPLVTEAHTVQRELASLPEHTFGEAQRILTVEQQAKLLLFRRDLQGEVRQAIRRRGTAAASHHSR